MKMPPCSPFPLPQVITIRSNWATLPKPCPLQDNKTFSGQGKSSIEEVIGIPSELTLFWWWPFSFYKGQLCLNLSPHLAMPSGLQKFAIILFSINSPTRQEKLRGKWALMCLRITLGTYIKQCRRPGHGTRLPSSHSWTLTSFSVFPWPSALTCFTPGHVVTVLSSL